MNEVFSQLPSLIQEAAQGLLDRALEGVYRPGESLVLEPYVLSSHTLGDQHREGVDDIRMGLWHLFGDFSDRGSIVVGRPDQGAFVSITPTGPGGTSLGAEELVELGRRVKKTIPLAKAEKLARGIAEWLEPYVAEAIVAGSIRRRRPEIGDVEFVVLPDDWAAFEEALDANGWAGGDRIRKKMVKGTPVELYIAHKRKELGAMVFMYTGDWIHNISMRSIAKRKGWKLDQYGIWDADSGELILQSPDEREFYEFLGVRWHEPEERSFQHRRKKGKTAAAAMGAELLIELGAEHRDVRHIHLDLEPDDMVIPKVWILKVERTDPHGGDPWLGEFAFRDENAARYWYEHGIQGDEDIDQLIRIFRET